MAYALVEKGLLFDERERFDEARAAYDEAINRFGMWNDELAPIVDGALAVKALLLVDAKRPIAEAVEVLETGLGRFPEVNGSLLGVRALNVLSGLLFYMGDSDGALARVDQALMVCEVVGKPHRPDATVGTLAMKGHVLRQLNRAVSESEAQYIFEHLVVLETLPVYTLEALIVFIAHVGPARALKLIQESPETGFLLPLMTALQQELGECPRVAKEVEEVAGDISKLLRKLVQEGHEGPVSNDQLMSPKVRKHLKPN